MSFNNSNMLVLCGNTIVNVFKKNNSKTGQLNLYCVICTIFAMAICGSSHYTQPHVMAVKILVDLLITLLRTSG